MILRPVILKVDEKIKKLKGSEFTEKLSLLAREALVLSGKLNNIDFPKEPPQLEDGTPLEFNGIYWSISHKPDYVMGCISEKPFGLDIEKIRKRSKDILNYVINDEEWSLLPEKREDWELFYRFWTGKESVLKAEKIGIAGLSRCRINKIISDTELEIIYTTKDGQKNVWYIKQKKMDNHIFAITSPLDEIVEWRKRTVLDIN